MKTTRYVKQIVFGVFALLILLSGSLKAQREDMIYFFRDIPQSNLLNPALTPTAGFYLSAAVGAIDLDFNTSGLSYGDVINTHPIYPDSLRIDIEGLSTKLLQNNRLNLDLNENIFGLGFRAGKNYFSFDVSLHSDVHLSFSRGLFDFVTYGINTPNHSISLIDGELLDLTAHLSAGVGYAREIGERLRIGFRAKMIFGLANVHTQEADATLTRSNNETLSLRTNLQVLTSTPLGALFIQTNPQTGENEFRFDRMEAFNLDDFLNNKGFAFDFGAAYRLSDKSEISFSVTDLGTITWNSNVRSIETASEYSEVSYSGVTAPVDSLGVALDTYINSVGDSLMNLLNLRTVEKSGFTTPAPTKIRAGYTLNFTKRNYLHALASVRYVNGKLKDTRLSVLYAFRTKYLSLSAGNTFTSFSLFNPSALLNLNLGFINFYVGGAYNSTKNISLDVVDMSGVSVFLGINLTFGKRSYTPQLTKKEKKEAKSQEIKYRLEDTDSEEETTNSVKEDL